MRVLLKPPLYAANICRTRANPVQRFWFEAGGYLYDVVDAEGGGNDDACRPNQVLAISLDHAVLDESRWKKVMDVVTERLLTPVGLRSLAPGHPDYKAKYYGDLRSRDAAYHQGTVWAWLIGPYVDAYLRLHPEELSTARKFLEGFIPHWMRHASVPSAKFLTPKPPIRPAGASRNRGAWRRYCVAG